MTDLKTVDGADYIDPLLSKQHEGVANMRASLLSCSDDPTSMVSAIRNVTLYRVYHQVIRIVRYLDLMDKLEDKLYEAIDNQIATADTMDMASLSVLLSIQTRLQQSMIESHKLLQPYLNLEEFSVIDISGAEISSTNDMLLIDRDKRDILRNKAQSILSVLSSNDIVVEPEE